MRVDLTPGFVLHTRPYRESSLLVEFLAREHGRVGLVARGARSGKSQRRALLAPFDQVLVSWSGRGELQTLSKIEQMPALPEGGARRLEGDWLLGGLYANELLMRLTTRHDPSTELYRDYMILLERLRQGAALEPSLRAFELCLFDHLGYALQLGLDAETGEPVEPMARYRLVLEEGPHRVADSATASLVFQGESLLAMTQLELNDPQILREARRLTHHVLRHYLGDKPLKSRELWRKR